MNKMIHTVLILFFSLMGLNSCTTSVEDPVTELPPSENFDAHYGTWNTDGTKILFHHTDLSGSAPKQYQLYVVNLQTNVRFKIFDGPSLNPVWSPDGQWIAFHSNSVPSSIYNFRSSDSTFVRLTGDVTPTISLQKSGLLRQKAIRWITNPLNLWQQSAPRGITPTMWK